MRIREFRLNDLKDIKRLIKKLHPGWFDKNALKNIPVDIRLQKCLVAEKGNDIMGFISISSQDRNPIIGWIGVDPDLHRKGIGRKLLQQAEKLLRQMDVKALRVKTVVEQNPHDGTYDKTLQFYQAMGFSLERQFKPRKTKNYMWRMGILKKILK